VYSVFNIIATIIITVLCIAASVAEVIRRLTSAGRIKSDMLSDFSKKSHSGRLADYIEKYWYLFAIIIMAIFAVTRLKGLNSLPYGTHIDEIGMLHEARDLAEYGTDRYGHSWPVYLKNYGGGMGPMYAYLTSVVLRFLPITIRNMRITGALISGLGLIGMFGAGVELSGKKTGGLVSAFLFTIFPSVMMMNRWDCDCHLFISLTAMSLFLLFHAFRTDKIRWYILASISFGVGMYTYLIACLVYPMFLVLLVAYMLWTRKLSIKKFCALFFPVVITALPLFVAQIVNMGIIPEFSLWGSDFFVFSPDRVGETSLSNIPGNIGVILDELINGDTLTYNAFSEFGALYTFMIPLILLGVFLGILCLIDAIKKREFDVKVLVILFAFSGYFMALTHSWPNLNRYQEMFVAFVLLMLIAVLKISEYRQELMYLIVIFGTIGFMFFGVFYFKDQREVYGQQFLFAEPDLYNVVTFISTYIDPAYEQKVYMMIPYDKDYLAEDIIPAVGHVSPQDWGEYVDGRTENIGRFYLYFPEEFDENEQAIYVIGRDWDHISDYLISIGFNCDESVPSMRVLWR